MKFKSRELAAVRSLASDLGPPISKNSIATSPIAQKIPEEHWEFLQEINGLTSFNGAFRLFGANRRDVLDIDSWNQIDNWRFAWDDRIEPFLMIAGSALGDQYAYRIDGEGKVLPEVYLLPFTYLDAVIIAPDFRQFLIEEWIPISQKPWDPLIPAAVDRFGPILPTMHWAPLPSPALGADLSVDNLILLPASTGMIFAGDIVSWVMTADESAVPVGIEHWADELGRPRLRVQT